VYVVIFKTSDNSSNLGPNYANVSEMGVYSSSASNWAFLSSDLPTDIITLRAGEIDQFFVAADSSLKTKYFAAGDASAIWPDASADASAAADTWYGKVWPLQVGDGWFVSAENGNWQYAMKGNDGMWVFDFDLGWYWTSEAYHPYIYLYDHASWAYFYPRAGQTTVAFITSGTMPCPRSFPIIPMQVRRRLPICSS
jgi:hypothetical protein